jgi:phosphoadenosine phosphosulfate reductase
LRQLPANDASEQSSVEDVTQAAKLSARLNAAFGAAEPAEILDAAVNREFRGRIALVSSFGAESAPLLHLVSEINRDTPVIFLDTQKHFAQTVSYRRSLARKLGLTNVLDIPPSDEELAREDPNGDLWRRDSDACCTLRKVRPLKKALAGFDAWITGRKQFHGGARLSLPVFEAAAPFVKVNPLVRWTLSEIDTYRESHELPPHPLVEQGFPSIGCWPCTHPAKEDEDARAGRWRGAAKTECGIHQI